MTIVHRDGRTEALRPHGEDRCRRRDPRPRGGAAAWTLEELLRRYLEQRASWASRELVLDRLTVDEVLRIVGAQGRRAAAPASPGEIGALAPGVTRRRRAAQSRAAVRASRLLRLLRLLRLERRQRPPSARQRLERRSAPRAPSAPPSASAPRSTELSSRSRPPGLVVGEAASASSSAARSAQARIARRDRGDGAHVHALSALRDGDRTPCPGEGNPDRGAHVRRRGAGREGGRDRAGRSSARRGSCSRRSSRAINLDAGGRVHLQRAQAPSAGQPQPDCRDEVAACSPYLVRQLELIRPKVILALGTFAAQTLLDTKLAIGKLRGAGAPVSRHAADRHLPPRRAAAQPGLEDAHLGRCPARPSNSRYAPSPRDPYRDRRPPYSEDAEQAVLSAMLMDQDAILRAERVRRRHDVLPRGPSPDLPRDGRHLRARRRRRSAHALRRAAAPRRARGERRQGLHRLPRRRGADGGERRVPRQDRPREGAAPPPHRSLDRHRRRGVRGTADRRRAARRGRVTKIFEVSQQRGREGFMRIKELLWPTMERIEALQRGGKSITGVAERLQRPRRADVRLPAVGPHHRRGASVDGKDGVHPEHRAARRDRAQRADRVLLARNEQGVARAAHAHVRGARRRADDCARACFATTTSRASRARRAS